MPRRLRTERTVETDVPGQTEESFLSLSFVQALKELDDADLQWRRVGIILHNLLMQILTSFRNNLIHTLINNTSPAGCAAVILILCSMPMILHVCLHMCVFVRVYKHKHSCAGITAPMWRSRDHLYESVTFRRLSTRCRTQIIR